MSTFDLTPEEVRRIGRLAADAVAEHRARVTEGPVFGKVGEAARVFEEPLPEEGMPFDALLDLVRAQVMTRPFGNSHPRFFGFINAAADPVGTVADYLASALNPNCWGGDHAAVHVERRVIAWLCAIVGLPETAEGILVSGGSTANLTALTAARRARTPGNVREEGVAAEGRPRPVVYASDQAHSCIEKSLDMLGLGTRALRVIPTDEAFRMRVDRLREAVEADRRAGRLPAIVVGNGGTVNTGSIDPLEELADFCAREDLWFHVDGAYGAMAALSDRLRPLLRGLERADSVAADPHKWLYVPFEAGAALVREPGRLADAFRKFPEYLASDPDSPFPGPVWFAERGFELSRSFKALKVWMVLKRHGRRAHAEAVERDVALARFLSEAVRGRPDLELLAEPVLSIANFRYRPRGLPADDAALDRLNRGIVNELVRAGGFFLAPTVLRGRASLRVSITNFRTAESDLVALLDEVEAVGRALRAR